MVTTVEDTIETTQEDEVVKYVFVFTEALTESHGVAYTAVIGQRAKIDNYSKRICAVEGALSSGELYIISVGPSRLSSRAYGGTVRFEEEDGIYFAVVFPDWAVLEQLEPALRWRFRYISFEYPRGGKRGFLLPTINSSPFAYCFITQEEKEIIGHLCPPMPVAHYMPEEYGYEKEELSTYLADEAEKCRHASELCHIISSIFDRSGGSKEQYLTMDKDLIPEEYRDYQMLCNAENLWDW